MKLCWSSTIVSIIRCAVLDLKIKIDGHCVMRSDPILIYEEEKKPISYSMLEWIVRRFSSIVIDNTHYIHSVVKMPTMNCKIYLQPITNNVDAAVAVPFFLSFFFSSSFMCASNQSLFFLARMLHQISSSHSNCKFILQPHTFLQNKYITSF